MAFRSKSYFDAIRKKNVEISFVKILYCNNFLSNIEEEFEKSLLLKDDIFIVIAEMLQ